MTDLQALLERMRKLDSKATPQPWIFKHREGRESYEPTYEVEMAGDGSFDDLQYYPSPPLADDAELIAAMRNLLGPLLDVVEAASKVRDPKEARGTWTPSPENYALHQAVARLAAKGGGT